MQAEFELEALLLTGSCIDRAAQSRDQVGAATSSLPVPRAACGRVCS